MRAGLEHGDRRFPHHDLVFRRRKHGCNRRAARPRFGYRRRVAGLWHLDVANAFQMAVRRQRIDAVYRDASPRDLALMPIRSMPTPTAMSGRRRCAWPSDFRSRCMTPPIWSWRSAAACRLQHSTRNCARRRRHSTSRCWRRLRGAIAMAADQLPTVGIRSGWRACGRRARPRAWFR